MRELALHILDIVQNSISANSTKIVIEIEENRAEDRFVIKIIDNGKGMTPEQLTRVTDPFFTTRTTRSMGFGIAFFKETAERAGGELTIESKPGEGTTITARMQSEHIDRPPLGDMAETLMCIIMPNPEIHFIYIHRNHQKSYRFDSSEFDGLIQESGGIDFTVLNQVKESIQIGLDRIKT